MPVQLNRLARCGSEDGRLVAQWPAGGMIVDANHRGPRAPIDINRETQPGTAWLSCVDPSHVEAAGARRKRVIRGRKG